MSELQLTGRLVAALRKIPGAVVFKHADHMTPGIPDVSVTVSGSTTWLEVKVGSVKGREQQLINMERLEHAGRCYYVIYEGVRTRIMRPSRVRRGPAEGTYEEASFLGDDHAEVARWVQTLHERYAHLIVKTPLTTSCFTGFIGDPSAE